MPTITNKQAIDQLIADNGEYMDDPPVLRIVEYHTLEGEVCWGLVYFGEPVSLDKYSKKSEYVRNPKIIFERADLIPYFKSEPPVR